MESRSDDVSGLAWKSLLVAAAGFAFLGSGVNRSGVAAALVNPVDQVRAQDESIYANAALRMAERGNWLTPVTLGRIYLGKPPLLYDLTALSLKIFGTSLFALRLPNLLAGALTAALLFFWCARVRGDWAGIAAALLLLSNPVWDTFARLCYTDMLLAFFIAAALFCLACDPKLERPGARWGVIASTVAAILTKSVAGAIPILVLCCFALWSRNVKRIVTTVAWIALLAAPWHLYQLAVHREWFWTDYVQMQLLWYGVTPLVPVWPENTVWYYARRLFATDPVLCAAAVLTLPAVFIDLKTRKPEPWLAVSWLAVVCGAILAFNWRSFPYAMLLIAPICLIAGLGIPAKFQRAAVAVLAIILIAKLTVWNKPSQPLAASAILRSYLERGRSNELILVDTDDQFYSATLPLPKVRYIFRDPSGLPFKLFPHYVKLGITVTADQFNDLGRFEPDFRDHLRAWGLDSTEPVATTIVAKDDLEVLHIIAIHPDSDFYLPAGLKPAPGDSHIAEQVSQDRLLLLAQRSTQRRVPPWPKNW